MRVHPTGRKAYVVQTRANGKSMEPELSEGGRPLVDTSRSVPETGEMFVLWGGNGLVVKRVDHLRLKLANPHYDDYTCLAQDGHIIGKVLWAVR